jgi:ion channel-forming bestrophin family protein
MVIYNPKDWLKLIFEFGKSDTFRSLLPALLGMGIYTAILAYVENHFFQAKMEDPTKVHNIVGFVLSMLLVFRINSAYDRWYEGRKQWGSLTNNARNLGIKLNSLIPIENKELRTELRILISNYAHVMKEHLRGNPVKDPESCKLFDQKEFESAAHKPNYIAKILFSEFVKLQKTGIIDTNVLLVLNEEVRGLTDICGSCERIKNTPIPYSYSLFLKKIIFLYVFTLPIGYVINFDYWAIPITMLVFYAFASIELISEEIEEPFGNDANDLPIDEFVENIKRNLKEIMG